MNQWKIKKYAGLSFVLICVNFGAQSQKTAKVIVQNKTSVNRIDELVVFNRTFLQKKTGHLAADDFVQIKQGGQLQPVQYDDLNGDGLWDEAVFLYSFKPHQSVSFLLEPSKYPASIKINVKAHVRHKSKMPDNSFGNNLLTDTMPFNNQPTDFGKQRLPDYLTEGPA